MMHEHEEKDLDPAYRARLDAVRAQVAQTQAGLAEVTGLDLELEDVHAMSVEDLRDFATKQYFTGLGLLIATREADNFLEYDLGEQVEHARKALEKFHAHTPLCPVLDGTKLDLAGFGEVPVHFVAYDKNGEEESYLLLGEVAKALGMPIWKASAWAALNRRYGIEEQRRADEERGDGRLGYEHLRDLVDLEMWFITDDPEAKPDVTGRSPTYSEWLIAQHRLPALLLVSPWAKEYMDNTLPAFGYAMRKLHGDKLKDIPTYGADGQPTGGNAYDDLFSTEGLTEDEARQRARRGPVMDDPSA
jgi:hypothetical protein